LANYNRRCSKRRKYRVRIQPLNFISLYLPNSPISFPPSREDRDRVESLGGVRYPRLICGLTSNNHRARATMAIPKLLGHVHHRPSKKVYLDSERSYLNPILLANKEHEIVSAGNVLAIDYPDIVVSLGTGFETSWRQNSKNSYKASIVSRLKGSASAKTPQRDTKGEISSSAEGHNEWNDYLNLLPISAPASRFVRLNPTLEEGLPAPDDIGDIKVLQTLVQDYYAHRDEIKRLTAQLFATLFYFECPDTIPKITDKQLLVQGKLSYRCSFKRMLS
jgi:hypothetical protein